MDFVLNLLQFLGLLVTATRGLASQVKEAEFELSVSHETTDNEPLQDKTPAYWTKSFAKLRYIGFHTWSKMWDNVIFRSFYLYEHFVIYSRVPPHLTRCSCVLFNLPPILNGWVTRDFILEFAYHIPAYIMISGFYW